MYYNKLNLFKQLVKSVLLLQELALTEKQVLVAHLFIPSQFCREEGS